MFSFLAPLIGLCISIYMLLFPLGLELSTLDSLPSEGLEQYIICICSEEGQWDNSSTVIMTAITCLSQQTLQALIMG